jgi:hypothetical protein
MVGGSDVLLLMRDHGRRQKIIAALMALEFI